MGVRGAKELNFFSSTHRQYKTFCNMTANTCRTKVVSPDLEEQIPLESPILFMVNKNALDGLAAYDLPERVPYPGWLIELYQDGDKQFMKVQFPEWAEENTEYDGELYATEDTMDIPLDDTHTRSLWSSGSICL